MIGGKGPVGKSPFPRLAVRQALVHSAAHRNVLIATLKILANAQLCCDRF
jgi:hypothetical protein